MSQQLEDLKAKAAAVEAAAQAAIAAINNLAAANAGRDNPADLEPIASALGQTADALNQAVAAITPPA